MISTNRLFNPLIISISGTLAMILARMIYAQNLYYGYLVWNLFLAAVPLFISNILYKQVHLPRIVLYVGLAIWLLFLPNAPYIITDLVHLHHRPPVPFWYDMLILLLSVMNGLALGFISITRVEQIIIRRNAKYLLAIFRVLVILVMSYGVFLGRYLRFNSWDIFFRPVHVMQGMADSMNRHTLAFVCCFSFVSYVLYMFFRLIPLFRIREVS